MALKPSMVPSTKQTQFNPTAIAIGVSLLIGIVGATIVAGNPFRAMTLAYLDYSHTPAGGAERGSPTKAPLTQGQAEEKKSP